MPTTKTLKRHANLVDRMATKLGVDFEEKLMEGLMEIDDISDAVLSCTSCSNPDGCEHWMNNQVGLASAAPDMCRNVDLFERLKAGKHA